MPRKLHILEIMLITLAALAVLLMDASVNELHGTAVFYASLIREMVTSGWLSIFEGERAYFLKPPLVLWLSSASAEIFGLTNFGVSLPSRVAGILSVALTYLVARKLYDHRVAALTCIVLITNSTFIQFSATLRMDSMLLFGGLLSIYAWLERDRHWSSAALFLGTTIGVLSKGPLGLAPILLIAIHAFLLRISLWEYVRWRWAWLLAPIFLWYGYLYALHGDAPFSQLGADLAKPAADAATSGWRDTVSEYVIKPARRYLPFLPFMLAGAWLSLVSAVRGFNGERQQSRWLILWFAIVFIAAAAKPDKDIRYLYMGLPVLSMFAAISLAAVQHRFRLQWLSAALATLTIVLALFYNFGPQAKPDTRPVIAAMIEEIGIHDAPLRAIGGYPIPPGQARRQNTHRDWIHFYLGREPQVLSWKQISPDQIRSGDAFFLTNNRTHEKRLTEYGLTAKYKTIEMVYAIRQ